MTCQSAVRGNKEHEIMVQNMYFQRGVSFCFKLLLLSQPAGAV